MVAILAGTSQASLIASYSTTQLAYNTVQPVGVYLSGGTDLVNAADLYTHSSIPVVTSIDLVTGAIFGGASGSVQFAYPSGDGGRDVAEGVTNNTNTFSDSGPGGASALFGTLTIDTTGLPIGTQFTISLTDSVGDKTDLNLNSSPVYYPSNVADATTFAIIPEPASGALLLLAVGGLAARRRRA